MNRIAGIAKVFLLTIITGGIYGAYWIFVNLYKQPEQEELGDTEKAAGEARNTIALVWLHFINR